MSLARKTLMVVAAAALAAIAANSGLLETTIKPDTPDLETKTATAELARDARGENGPLPKDPKPPPRALKPVKGLTDGEQAWLAAREIYLHAPLALGPVQIQAGGHRGRTATLQVTYTDVPAATAHTALKAARYAYNDRTRYQVNLRAAGHTTAPGTGPVAAATAQAVRKAVAIPHGPGRTAINLTSIIDVSCKRAARRHICAVTTVEFLADRKNKATNAHIRRYQATITTKAGKAKALKVTAAL